MISRKPAAFPLAGLVLLAVSARVSSEPDIPVISLNLAKLPKGVTKVHASKKSVCHTTQEWQTLLYGGEKGFKIPSCLHDDSGVKLIHAVRCEVSTASEKSCPEPDVKVVDHHEGDLSDALRIKKTLCIKSAPHAKPQMVHKKVKDVNYSERGEYLFTYSAEDSSGNQAEDVQFAMILEDKVPPVFKDLTGLPSTIESLAGWTQYLSIKLNKKQVIDEYDGDVSDTLSMKVMREGEPVVEKLDTSILGETTVAVKAHDFANIFGKNNLDNVATTYQIVNVVDRVPPTVVCQESLTKPVICTKDNCANACPCGTCPTLEVDCEAGLGDHAGAACIDYHDSFDGSRKNPIVVDALKPSVKQGETRVVYRCTDSSKNTAVASRPIKRLDHKPPSLELPLVGKRNSSLELDLTCGEYENRGLLKDAITDGVGYAVSDSCDPNPFCTLSLYEGTCGGKYSCMDKKGKWTRTCDGGSKRKILATMATQHHDVDEKLNAFVAPFMDGEFAGTYGLKYTCKDQGENVVSRCRTITNNDSPLCNPRCAAGEYESAFATPTSNRECTRIQICPRTQYQLAAPTRTSDRVCEDLTMCNKNQWQSEPAESVHCELPHGHRCLTSDRTCTDHSVPACNTAKAYEYLPPSFFTDRVCKPLTVCGFDEFEHTPATPNSDRVCKPKDPVDCVPGWSVFKRCKEGIGRVRTKIRTETEPVFSGKKCPRFDYNSRLEDKIYVTSFTMKEKDAKKFEDPAEKVKIEERFSKKLQPSAGSVLLGVPMIDAKYFEVGATTGVDISFVASVEYEKAEHCQDIGLEIDVKVTLPDSLVNDVAKCMGRKECGCRILGASHQCDMHILLKHFIANHFDADPKTVTMEYQEEPPEEPSRGLTTTEKGGVFVANLVITKSYIAECMTPEQIAAKVEAFVELWRSTQPRLPAPKYQQKLLDSAAFIQVGQPEVDLSDPDPAHFLHGTSFRISKDSFSLECPVDCELGAWEKTPCSAECGGGITTATRRVIQKPLHGGEPCGPTERKHVCNTQKCSSDCKLQEWSGWSACSKSCGGGMQCRDAFNRDDPRTASCPGQQCRECNPWDCNGKCNNEGYVGLGCRERPYCCDSKMCYIESQCAARKGLLGTLSKLYFCEPSWYEFCSEASANGTPCSFEKVPMSATADSVCAEVSLTCPTGKLLTVAPTKTTDARCTSPTRCLVHEYTSSSIITPLKDKTCEPYTVTCNGGKSPLVPKDRACGEKAPFCDESSEYISEEPTRSNDVACARLGVCGDCSNPPQGVSDRICLTLGFDGVPEADYRVHEIKVLQSIADATEQLAGVGAKISNVVSRTGALVMVKQASSVAAAAEEAPLKRAVCSASKAKCTACSACCNAFVGEKASRCGECVRDECTSSPTFAPTATPTVAPTPKKRSHYQMYGDRLVVDLAIKTTGGNFAAIMTQQKNIATPVVDGVQSSRWKSNLCQALQESFYFKHLDCNKLHVYSVDCVSLRTTPVLTLSGPEVHFVSADTTKGAVYVDPGSACADEQQGKLRVRVGGIVDLAEVGRYKLSYSCENDVGRVATRKRVVIVQDTRCPSCVITGDPVQTVEASFPYADDRSDLHCSDMFDVQINVAGVDRVDVEQVGEYKVTYSATDGAGNTNTDCGARPIVRTVKVVDTLKPVLAIRYKGGEWHSGLGSKKTEVSPITGRKNPAKENFDSIFQRVLNIEPLQYSSKATKKKPLPSKTKVQLMEILPEHASSARMLGIFVSASMAVALFATIAALAPRRGNHIEEV